MFKIVGKHAIVSAAANNMRKRRVFYGTKESYEALKLRCDFKNHKEEFLEVNELYIPASLEKIISTKKIILLDSLEDPHNLGSIIRSAAILGYSVLIRKNRGCSINQTVLKCASGGIDETYIMEISNLQEIFKIIKSEGFWIYGLSENGDSNVKKNEKVMLIIGSEGNGMKYLTKKNCDYFFRLNGKENFHIYNASVAAAISMYQFNCQTWDSNP